MIVEHLNNFLIQNIPQMQDAQLHILLLVILYVHFKSWNFLEAYVLKGTHTSTSSLQDIFLSTILVQRS